MRAECTNLQNAFGGYRNLARRRFQKFVNRAPQIAPLICARASKVRLERCADLSL